MAISYITFSLINQIFIKFYFPDPVPTRKESGSGSPDPSGSFLQGAPQIHTIKMINFNKLLRIYTFSYIIIIYLVNICVVY